MTLRTLIGQSFRILSGLGMILNASHGGNLVEYKQIALGGNLHGGMGEYLRVPVV